VSDALFPYAIAHGARPGRVRVLPNGVDTDAFTPPPIDRDADHPTGPVRFGFVGSFKAWHGCDLLLEATLMARDRHADLELLLVGEGPQRAALEEVAGHLGLAANVRFLGARGHQEIPAFLHGLDVAVAPAPAGIDYYFSPLKVWEYAAAGRAIIAPRAGQVAERLRHAEDAWLVEPGSPAELAAAMMELAGNPELRRRLGDAAGARARAEFSWSRVARRLLVWLDDAGVSDAARSERPAPPATWRGSTP
jgi:glycosyltransferase involved in cell wall biosynthesis